jgi:predicted N-formylglutamate amidohydrolase
MVVEGNLTAQTTLYKMLHMYGEASAAALIGPDEGPAVEVLNPQGRGAFVLACEHASNLIPHALGDLGLPPEALVSHIAWDPGAFDVSRLLSEALDAPLVAARFSRLVFDCNRPPEASRGIAQSSEGQAIPGNAHLDEIAAESRVAEIHGPFHSALAAVLRDRLDRGRPLHLLTVHSFTPVYFGRRRAVELGVLHDTDTRLADAVLRHASRITRLDTRRNEPYGPQDGVTFTLREHGVRHGVANVMLEIRNDLIADTAAASEMAAKLAEVLRLAASDAVAGAREPW